MIRLHYTHVGSLTCAWRRLDQFGVEPFRYFLLRHGGLTSDGDYDEREVVAVANAELANTWGNSGELFPRRVLEL